MPQRFCLDRLSGRAYLALVGVGVLAGCGQAPGPVVPVTAGPVSLADVQSWAEPTIPHGHALHQFRWLYRNERSSAGGIGRVRVAGPDTLRFDARGPLGSGRMAAVVVGDSALWARPEEDVAKLVPNYPLLWAMFGVARPPADAAALRGIVTERLTAWSYIAMGDTVEYALSRGTPPRLVAEVRRAGGVLGRVETTLSPDGRPLRARLIVPRGPARLDLTFVATDTAAAFSPETWRPPEP